MSRERKSKKSDRKSFRGEFSFVNKDASNIDSKEHNAHVSWHVVNRYERWKRQEQTKTSPEAEESSQHPMQTLPGQSSSMLPNEENPFASYPPSPWNIDNAEQSMLESASVGNSRQYEQTSDFGLETARSVVGSDPSLTRQETITTQNFETFLHAAQFPPLITKILAYSAETIVPTLWPERNGRYEWLFEVSRTLEELKTISVDPCYASATLCYYATVMASISGDSDIASQACFFQTQAMAELQCRIRPQPEGYSVFTLKAILRLFSAETALDNTSTARIHLKMLRNIITREGGVILLDAWFRENLLSADTYFALKYETRPLFPTSEWTPGPLSQPWRTRLASARLTDEHTPTIDAAVDSILKTIMMDLRELFRVQRYVDLYEIPPDDQLLRWRQLRKYDCLSRLADHQLGLKIYPHLFERPRLQSAICAAIALMAAMVLGGPEPTRFDLKLTSDLRERVINARDELEHEIRENAQAETADTGKVRYWLLYVGMLSERCHAIPTEKLWFDSELKLASDQLGLQSPADCVAINKQFLFSQSLVDDVEAVPSKQRSGSIHGIYEACGTSWRKSDNSMES